MTFQVNTSILPNADGSAELVYTNNGTKVLCSVSGPIEPKPRQELPQQASLEIIVRPARGLSTTREKLIEDKLRSLLQNIIIRYKYPRQLILIVVQFLVVDEDPVYLTNELSAAINCCFFALVDADVALYWSFASVAVCIKGDGSGDGSGNGEQLIKSPTGKEIAQSDSFHVVCFGIENGKVEKLLLLESAGDFTELQLFDMLGQTVGDVESLHQLQRKAITKKVEGDYIWRGPIEQES